MERKIKRKDFAPLNYNDCKEIDKYNLDEELVKQPQLFYEYSTAYAIAQVEAQMAKDAWEMKKSELEIEIKSDPQKFGLKKDTESSVKAKIMTIDEVEKLYSRYMEKLKIEKILSKAERAFEHRKKSLEGLVALQLQNYFSQPKTTEAQTSADSKDLVKRLREKKRRNKSG